jgi:hypothetical protein
MKQTAVEWLLEQLHSGKELSTVIRQAKAMEKEQHQETFKQSRQAKIFEKGMPPVWESFEDYINSLNKQD